MSREWKPGDVAMVNGRVCMRVDGGWEHGDPRAFRFADDDGLRVTRLAVIDPQRHDDLWHEFQSRREQGVNLRRALREALDAVANPTPPKPDEPTGLGAVVEDAEGNRWVRYAETALAWMHWRSVERDTVAKWSGIDAVRVLSEGVTP